jgi:TetR/AcrR family transcriptional regulator, transcriptional repressor for nem operon
MSETRDYIIDKAYGLFLSKSYEAVSISDLSNAIGLTKGAIYHHFRSKEEIFKAVIDKYVVFNPIELNQDGITFGEFIELCIQKAEDIIKQAMSSAQNYIPIDLLSLIIDALRHYSGFSVKKNNLVKSDLEKIKKMLDVAIANGEIRSDINTSVMAEIFFTLNIGVARNIILSDLNPESAIDQMRDQMNEFYKLLIK